MKPPWSVLKAFSRLWTRLPIPMNPSTVSSTPVMADVSSVRCHAASPVIFVSQERSPLLYRHIPVMSRIALNCSCM